MKHRFKVLMLACAAVCALTAVSASAAQAGELYVLNGSTLETFTGTTSVPSAGGPFTLVSKIGKTTVTITCKKQAATFSVHNGTDPTGNTGMTGSGDVTFSECSVVGAGACIVPNITTKDITIHTKVVGGKEFLMFRPTTGAEFATLVIEGCALEGKFPVNGETAGFDPAAATASENHTLNFSGTISGEAGTALTFGGNAATLEGSSVETMSPGFAVK